MKKENNSDLREALRLIIDERTPLSDSWQQSVLASMGEAKPRRIMWWRGVAAAAAAVAAVILSVALLHKAPQPESAVTYSEVVVPSEEPQPLPQPEPLPAAEPPAPSEPAPTKLAKPKAEPRPAPEPIVIITTDYLADGVTPDPDSDLMPDEWIESLLTAELTQRYITMISILDTEEEETANTPEL